MWQRPWNRSRALFAGQCVKPTAFDVCPQPSAFRFALYRAVIPGRTFAQRHAKVPARERPDAIRFVEGVSARHPAGLRIDGGGAKRGMPLGVKIIDPRQCRAALVYELPKAHEKKVALP